MAILVKCKCGKDLRVKDELRGKKVKCPECESVLTIEEAGEEREPSPIRKGDPDLRRPPSRPALEEESPPRRSRRDDPDEGDEPPRRRRRDEDDEDERPRRRGDRDRDRDDYRPRKKQGGGSKGLLIGLLVGAAVLLLGGCVVGSIFLFKSNPTSNRLTFQGGTARTSSRLMLIHRDKQSLQRPAKKWVVPLEAGKTYTIEMMDRSNNRGSLPFDPYLVLDDPDGRTVAEDDDSGHSLNSRIHFRCSRSGDYAIIATSYKDFVTGDQNDTTGAYELVVTEIGGGGPAPGNNPGPGPGESSTRLTLGGGGSQSVGTIAPADGVQGKTAGPYKLFTVTMSAGKTYRIDLRGRTPGYDPYLRLDNPNGMAVAQNDDRNGLDSQIIYSCTQSGDYKIYASSNGPINGIVSFELDVREFDRFTKKSKF